MGEKGEGGRAWHQEGHTGHCLCPATSPTTNTLCHLFLPGSGSWTSSGQEVSPKALLCGSHCGLLAELGHKQELQMG